MTLESKLFAGMRNALWSSEETAFLSANHGRISLSQIASSLGRSPGSIRGKITKLGISKQVLWTAEEEAALINLYAEAGADGVLRLNEFAASIGREKGNVCRKAKLLGLTTNPHRRTVERRKPKLSTAKYATPEERSAAQSKRLREWHASVPHPMLGKTHSEETRKRIGAASKAALLFQTEEQKRARYLKAMKTKVERYGSVAANRVHGTWKAGWREIGGKRNFYRSRWEANYARYLQWLKDGGHIVDWIHEPETFWFEQIKRGTRSYLPDFRVWENDGSNALHEVKGWMDQRSRTTLKRMKKYHPHEKIVLVDGVQYRAIRRKVMTLIEGWEDSARDSHA